MEWTRSKQRSAIWCILQAITTTGQATPTVAFPFNSQVPTVARVGEAYEFQFSASTFAPDASNFTYSMSDQPAWLSVDSATRTLIGAPSQADVGASSFTLTAADSSGAAHMACKLIVSTDPAPQMKWGISDQLAADGNLSSSQPPIVTVLPSSQFSFDFRQDSFIDIVQRKLSYYATLTDHTPLPSWLLFNDQDLTFSGIAPQLSGFSQSWSVDLIASDVEGFAGATASFTIAVGTQQLAFVPEDQDVNITAGKQVELTTLANALFMNGEHVPLGDLKSAEATVPSWLSFDPKTLLVKGTVPESPSDQQITVTVTDNAGNRAAAVVNLVVGVSSLFVGHVGTLTARSGQMFNYYFSDALFSDAEVDLMVTLPVTAAWLHFDSSTRDLSGKVPTQTSSSAIQVTLTAKSADSSAKQTQIFTIDVEAATSPGYASSKTTSRNPATSSPRLNPTTARTEKQGQTHLTKGAIAAIVVAAVLSTAMLVAFLILCLRRRRDEGYGEAASPVKRTISRPILPPDADSITVTTEVQTDVEKAEGSGPRERPEHVPQISLSLPSRNTSRRSKWSKRFSHISQASSLGNGEDAIRADSNIPELGRESSAFHTPHDSFSVPAKIARSSRQLTELSPSKRALRRQRETQDSRQSVGLGIDTGGAGLLPRHSSKGARSHRKAFSSLGLLGARDDRSVASFSTRGTSVLSTKASDFPRPPTRSSYTLSRSIPTLALSEADKRKSIRLVGRSDSSIADNRSLQEKRQSFIRNRASTSFASPLFSHGSRVSSNTRQNGQTESPAPTQSRSRRGKSQINSFTTYSESSSLEPPPRDPRRLSARVRSAFAPNFPRAITRSTLGASGERGPEDDEDYYTTESSMSEADLAAELALPRHQRNFVLPGEASPTPPPAPPTSRQASSRQSTLSTENGRPRQKWKERLRDHSSSPLSTAVAVPLADRNSISASAKVSQGRRSRLSEPLSLVSNDSLSRAKLERPRLVQTNSKRPVSVEKVRRLSSLKAETEDTRPGSEMWEAMEGAGLMPPNSIDGKEDTQKSNMSGAAFL